MPQPLEICVHLTNGTAHRFSQEAPDEVRDILEGVHPNQLFDRPQLILAGKHSMSLIRSGEATRIDSLNPGLPDWPRLGGAQQMSVILEEAYLQRIAAEPEARVRVIEAGERFLQWARLECAGGQMVHLEMEGKARQRLERMRLISHVLSQPAVWAGLPEGGFTVINMTKVLAMTIVPGPPEAPRDAWVLNPVQSA
jgi:hypothetical protein